MIRTSTEIFALVNEKQKKIEELLDPATFILNPEIQKLQNEIDEIRKYCLHEYVRGFCLFCGKVESEDNK